MLREGRKGRSWLPGRLVHGQDVRLTMTWIFSGCCTNSFRKIRGCSVAMNPCTGEVLALVSTPSYDDNAFILGLSGAPVERLEWG